MQSFHTLIIQKFLPAHLCFFGAVLMLCNMLPTSIISLPPPLLFFLLSLGLRILFQLEIKNIYNKFLLWKQILMSWPSCNHGGGHTAHVRKSVGGLAFSGKGESFDINSATDSKNVFKVVKELKNFIIVQ